MFYWLSTYARYGVAMSYDSNFMDKVKGFWPRHTDMIKARCPLFHCDTQKYYICVEWNTSKFKNPIIISFTTLSKAKDISEMEM